MKRLVILDRDGVINVDSEGFIKSPAEWIAIPDSLTAIARMNQAGFIVCIATNQSGVGRGLFTLETLAQIHEKMREQLNAVHGKIDEILYCPHTPEDQCACRKPKPGMMISLLNKFQLRPENTWVIGDALRDLQAGAAAGCHTILVKTGKGAETLQKSSDLFNSLIFNDLNAAATFLCQGESTKYAH